MKWLVYGAAALLGAGLLLAAIGYALPVAHEASRSVELSHPPHTVFALVSNLDGYASWWPDNDVRSEVLEAVPPSRLVTRIVGETAFGGTWTWSIEPTPTGARATITERGEIYNPVFRALARFVFGYTSTMESCLTAVQKQLGTMN